MPLRPVAVPAFHKFAFGGGAAHRLDAGPAADDGALLPQANGGTAFVWVHNDDGAERNEVDSPAGAAGSLFVSTTAGAGDCGTLCHGADGVCGVTATGVGDGTVTVPGVVTFNVGETGGCGRVVGGSTSRGDVCE